MSDQNDQKYDEHYASQIYQTIERADWEDYKFYLSYAELLKP